jgi:hypothetical protein
MKNPDLSEWIQRYFQDYLVRQRNVNPATVAAYRDTFRLLLQYWRRKPRQALATLSLESLTPDSVLSFLNHLEQSRGNSIRTRNARLAVLHSFVHYLTDWLGPELPAATRRILTLPFKRHVNPLIGFLSIAGGVSFIVIPSVLSPRRRRRGHASSAQDPHCQLCYP